MARLLCPKCSTTFTPEEGTTPKCPRCGYTSSAPPVSSSGGGAAAAPGPSYGQAFAYPGQPPSVANVYGAAGAPGSATPPGPQKTAGMAIASFVLGLLGWLLGWIPPLIPLTAIGLILAIVFGAVANGQINKDPRLGGKGLATAGLVLGIVGLVLYVLVVLFVMLFFAAFFNAIF